MEYKFLIVEDEEESINDCCRVAKVMQEESATDQLFVHGVKSFDEANEELNKGYHGVIVDINLKADKDGNDVIKYIMDCYRIPVVIMTATPSIEDCHPVSIKRFIKGEVSYEKVIQSLIDSYSTGIFEIMGGKGVLEKIMNTVFWDNLYPQLPAWERVAKEEGEKVQDILLRYALAHVQELIDVDVSKYKTEEMYIKPALLNKLRTGTILKRKMDNIFFVVLSPPCDLAEHNGNIKTDRIMMCEIECMKVVNRVAIKEIRNRDKIKKRLIDVIKNNYTDYYHWLPESNLFAGGYINFRKVLTADKETIDANYEDINLRIQEYFVKDILGRFSSYYSRQGQPDFDFDKEVDKYMDDSTLL